MQRGLNPKVDTYDPATHRGLRIEGGAGFIGAWRHMTYHEVIAQDRQLERAAEARASEPQRHRESGQPRALPVARLDRIGRMA